MSEFFTFSILEIVIPLLYYFNYGARDSQTAEKEQLKEGRKPSMVSFGQDQAPKIFWSIYTSMDGCVK
jgi:hypothetical protein